jgi:hypothetical protein
MNRSNEADSAPSPECLPTLARIHRALDGDVAVDLLTADEHAESCRNCRERLAAARLLVMGLTGIGSVAVPSWLSGAIIAGIDEDRRACSRRRVFAMVGGLAAAAAIVVAIWATSGREQGEMARQGPAPTPAPSRPRDAAPPSEPRPIRVNDELAKASDALRDSSRVFSEPLESAPKILGGLTDPLFKPATLTVSADLDPARQSLAEIPDAARAGLEPVTGSAQKALDRLLRDISGMQPAKPKS